MDAKQIRKMAKSVTTGEAAGRATDPAFYQALRVLPNPDPILRSMGRAEASYDAIMSDAHVIGELRSMRSGLLSYTPRVVAAQGADNGSKQTLALELCKQLLSRVPAPGMQWSDVIWNMGTAVLRGYRVHEVDWQYDDGYLLPAAILDRPNRRFKFDTDNQLKLLTKAQPTDGEKTEPYRYLVSRHMPSTENPYGQALLSSCFWPYTFKHGGWKFLYQFCERYGLPWPIGRFPEGTNEHDQNELLERLLDMLESSAAVIPQGDSVELLTANQNGELVQESMIHLCNSEMSKALTSQTLATEMRKVGSNAASKTHHEREQVVQASDRAIIEATMNQVFADITRFNCGDDILPPVFELYKPKMVSKERAEIWEMASRIGNPSKAAFHKEMNIPEAKDDKDRLQASAVATGAQSFSAHPSSSLEYKAAGKETLAQAAIRQADAVIESDLIEPIFQMLTEYENQGKSLQQFLNDLPELFKDLDTSELAELNSQVIQLALSEGIVSV